MRIKYGDAAKTVLLILMASGMIAVAATSPYFLIALTKSLLREKKYLADRGIKEKNLRRSLAGLNKNKIVVIKNEKDKFVVRLTEKGRSIVKEILFDDMKIEKQKSWDKKWRIVIFDIPEKKRRSMRDAMRFKLQLLGFYQMQKSVWVCPYPCEKEIQLVCEVFDINPYVNLITAEKIYNDDVLAKHFKLIHS